MQKSGDCKINSKTYRQRFKLVPVDKTLLWAPSRLPERQSEVASDVVAPVCAALLCFLQFSAGYLDVFWWLGALCFSRLRDPQVCQLDVDGGVTD